MTIEAISGTLGVSSTPPTTAAPRQEMDGEMFMSLLVTQLRNQDPSSPMDTNQMITQTTQLATMEKLTSMADTSTESFSLQMRNTAATLIGQKVSYLDPDGATVTGLADSVTFAGGVPQVTVNGVSVALDAISGILSSASTSTTSTTPTTPTRSS